jgi:peptidyl-prolyl cis-trans isomerase B (cyclophilin B)
MTVAVATLALFAAACGGDDDDDKPSEAPKKETATSPAPDTERCRRVDQPEPKPEGRERKPSEKLDPERTYRLRLNTSCGEFAIELSVKSAPETTASLVSLARDGFYDGTTFHRALPAYLVQGGDPTGTGAGGPGYTTVEPPPDDAKYVRGVVAMAKTQQEAPGTAGSQFFVVTAQDAKLPPEYAIVGRVTEGLEAADRIAALGNQASGGLRQTVVIESVEVEEA